MGLDPQANRLQREAAQAEKDQPPLDPPFPFRPTAFDPWFFGIQKQPKASSRAAPIDTRAAA